MLQYIEFFAVAAFAVTYIFTDIYWATGVFMAAAVLQTIVIFAIERKVPGRTLAILILALVFGSLTLWLQDPRFIQWRPTIVSWVMSIALVLSKFILKKDLLKAVTGGVLNLPDRAWSHITVLWAILLLITGSLNLLVAYQLSEEVWVTYKFLAAFVFPILYVGLTATYLIYSGVWAVADIFKKPNETAPAENQSTDT